MRRFHLLATLLITLLMLGSSPVLQAQGDSHYFSETGHTVKGKFWQYWQQHGGLAQQGYPISDEMQEKSDLNAQTYTVQYFERAEFEYHPENQPPYDILLTPLGSLRLKSKYPAGNPTQEPNSSVPGYFPLTHHSATGRFLTYWQQHGGLAQQGYPITEEFNEVSDLNGRSYQVQYFERAVFEYHPDNQPPNDVLLSQLGTFRYKDKYQAGAPPPPPAATSQPAPSQLTASASVDNPSPHHNQRVTVTGTLKDAEGRGVAGAEMRTIWHYKSTDSGCTGGPTDSNGVASCSRDISTATYGYRVNIDVDFILSSGQIIHTSTGFTPQAP